MQGFNRQYSGGGRQNFGGGGGGYGGAYDNRGSPMGGGGPMRGPGDGYPDGRIGNMGHWDSGMGSYGPGRNMGLQGRDDLRQSLNTMRDPGGRENTLALGILDAVKSLGVLGGGYGPQGGRQGPPQQGYGGRQDQMRPNPQNNRTLVQLTQSGGQMPPGPIQQNFNRGPQQNWNKSPNFANRAGPKGNMLKRLGSNPGNKNKVQQNKKNKVTPVKTLNKVVKKASPKKDAETVETEDNPETETTIIGENGASEVTKSSESDKMNDDTPQDALKCHMCDVQNFTSVTSYLNHLESQAHQQMTDLFHAKGRLTFQLLQANAALACQRIMNKSRKVGVKGRILECFKCQCRIPFTLAKHINSPEHQQVINFMSEKCCGRSYNNREDLEEHRLSLVHLRRQMACDARKDEKEDNDQEQLEALGMGDLTTEEQQAALNGNVKDNVQAVKVEVAPHYTPDTIPPYDPDSALGKTFVLSKSQYHCRCCRQFFPSGKNAIENHCRSSNHYEHFVAYVKQQAAQKKVKIESSNVNDDTDDTKEECKIEKVETSKAEPEGENDIKKEQESDEDELELEDLDAMETIDIPLDGDKEDDLDYEEDDEEEENCEEEEKMEDEVLVNEDIELQEDLAEENGDAEEEGDEYLTEGKMAASCETENVNEAEAEELDFDDDVSVSSPVAHEEEDDDDDDDDEDDDDEEINHKRRARGPAKSTPAKRALGAAPSQRGGKNCS